MISEEAVTIYGYAWFKVDAGQFVKIQSELAFNTSNVILSIVLVERSTDSEVDSVDTYLVEPQGASVTYPTFPGLTTTPTSTDSSALDSMMSMMINIMMMVMMMSMVTGVLK
jgi:hypothetical protein